MIRSFDEQTVVEKVAEGIFSIEITEEWNAWCPNGGFLTAVMLRAAHEACGGEMVVRSLSANFIRPCRNGSAKIKTSQLTKSNRTCCISVELLQRERVNVQATIWLCTAPEGPSHDRVCPVPPPISSLSPLRKKLGSDFPLQPWQLNLEEYYVDEIEDWDNREPSDPRVQAYMVFNKETPVTGVSAAGRLCVIADLMPYFGFIRKHPRIEFSHITPTLKLDVTFTVREPVPLTIYAETDASWSNAGVLYSETHLYDEQGGLLASSTQSGLHTKLNH